MMPFKLMAVMRPRDPALALKLTREWQARVKKERLSEHEAQEAFNRILQAQDYMFVGINSPDGEPVLVSPDTGKVIGKLEPGDSFIPYEDLQKMVRVEARPRICLVTKNQCGTDTWAAGSSCPCVECQAWLKERRL